MSGVPPLLRYVGYSVPMRKLSKPSNYVMCTITTKGASMGLYVHAARQTAPDSFAMASNSPGFLELAPRNELKVGVDSSWRPSQDETK